MSNGRPMDVHWTGRTIPRGQRSLMANLDMSANFVRDMLLVNWAPCQVCCGQNALQYSNLPDKIHYEKDWVLTTNCADENTWPLPGNNLVS